MSAERVARLLGARSVAVVGASDDPKKVGGRPIDYLRRHGYGGAVYPINPSRATVQGLPGFKTLADVSGPIDLALICVDAANVFPSLKDCVARGVGGAVVFSSGYAETGPEGRQLQRQLANLSLENDLPLVGPNCIGFVVPRSGLTATFMTPLETDERLLDGNVGIITQSGATGTYIFSEARARGIGISAFVNGGNEASLHFADYASYLVEDPRTSVIAGYIEGFEDGRPILDVATRAAERGKQVVILKGGSSPAGTLAASSHTGLLSGSDEVTAAAFKQYGIVRAYTLTELLDLSAAFATSRPVRGRRVGILSMTGGGGVLLADYCHDLGMEVPQFERATVDALRALLPPFAALNNPLDMTGMPLWKPELVRDSLRVMLADPNVDVVVVCLTFGIGSGQGATWATQLLEQVQVAEKPVMVAWLGALPEHFSLLRSGGVPVFDDLLRCVKAVSALSGYFDGVDRHKRARPSVQSSDGGPASGTGAETARGPERASLAEAEAKSWLRDKGFPVANGKVVSSAEECVRAAREIGYPVVAKIVSRDILHKSDIGGVRLNIRGEAEVVSAHDDLVREVRAKLPSARIDGVLVEEMVGPGVEAILGVTSDPQFGPVLMFGLGGVFVELFKDVSHRVLPISIEDARDMVQETRAHALLSGARGRPPCDVDALVNAMVRLSEAVSSEGGIAELDINPLIVLPEGQGVRIADAMITFGGRDER